jgi:molecular chaperone DnaK
MAYSLGIDLGTTYSAAAVHRDGRARIVELGARSASIPSVVYLRDDGTIVTGDAAQRRATADPGRAAREFKRRLGDTTPILLGGSPYSAEALSARLVRAIVDSVVEREGGDPAAIAITHPANWGPYKIDLLGQAVRIAGLPHAHLATEPDAAVRHYADHERIEPGSVIAVYDLGGGTFDAAVLRKTDTGFQPLGRPEGIERLGGIDFDAAVVGHVVRALDGAIGSLDHDDPAVAQALTRLHQDCVEAKEALSADTDVSIPVLLPTVQTEVRLTRSELETMIRPALVDSLDAVRRALASASLTPDDVDTVVLVGGSSRIPLIAQMVSHEFGRPVSVDADPKHAIALGAALIAAERASDVRTPTPDSSPGTPAVVSAGAPVTDDAPAAEDPAADHDSAAIPLAGTAAADVEVNATVEPTPDHRVSRTPIVVGVAAAALAALIGGLVVRWGAGGDGPQEAAAVGTSVAPTVTTVPSDSASTAASTTPSIAPVVPVAPATSADAQPAPAPAADVPATSTTPPPTPSPETIAPAPVDAASAPTPCPTAVERAACIVDISVDAAGGLVATYVVSGYEPELEPIGDHIHFYFDTAVRGDERNAGSAGAGGDWRLWDAPNPFTATGGEQGRTGYTLADARLVGATALCAIVARPDHSVVPGTGNCIGVPEG